MTINDLTKKVREQLPVMEEYVEYSISMNPEFYKQCASVPCSFFIYIDDRQIFFYSEQDQKEDLIIHKIERWILNDNVSILNDDDEYTIIIDGDGYSETHIPLNLILDWAVKNKKD